MPASVQIVIDPVALQRFVNEGGGPVLRYALQLGDLVKARAKELVEVSEGEGPHTRDAIVKRISTSGGQVAVHVGVFTEPKATIAFFNHEGTRPHTIVGNPLLVFFWKKTNRVMYLRSVNHPGTRATKFLTRALQEVLGR
jgi:hypothetical protein